jgi:hypothetical protein
MKGKEEGARQGERSKENGEKRKEEGEKSGRKRKEISEQMILPEALTLHFLQKRGREDPAKFSTPLRWLARFSSCSVASCTNRNAAD